MGRGVLMRKTIINVIGLGEIGYGTFKGFYDLEDISRIKTLGTDIDSLIVTEINRRYFKQVAYTDIQKDADIYIICVLTSKQVYEVFEQIPKGKIVVVESTVDYDVAKYMANSKDHDVVFFPHRFSKDDAPNHQHFNTPRVMSATSDLAFLVIKELYKFLMKEEDIIKVNDWEIAVLSKIVENTTRFIEIAFAEEMKMMCDYKNIDFTALRNAVNTKWNINIKEARDGIGRHCLPKDILLFKTFFNNSDFASAAIRTDNNYKEYSKNLEKLKKEFVEHE
jgi:UDP-N-acetyl-D-mannosaminuronate dehydrogenase